MKIKLTYYLLLVIVITSFSSAFSQKAFLEGVITDSLSQPIPHTNIIARPLQDSDDIAFAIAGFDGRYKLNMKTDVRYNLEITSMGYTSIIDSLKINKNTIKNYVLKQSTTSLEDVVIKAKMAMIVKEDTITFRTEKFRTGEERKLRDVLKKLPGVEVDRDGGVTINGKQVSKLMVDGQDFFGGDTKLGVNNIPADAVDEVEAIDNYHAVAFMKGLSDSDLMVINIKLKEDKKNFVFGEIEVGGGARNRYYLHPRIFYFSPNTTFNYIGSLDNINDSPFDFRDMIRFRGENYYSNNTVKSGDDQLTSFMNSSNIKHKKMQFSATNFTQKINSNLRLEAYSILAKQEVQSETNTNIAYLTQEKIKESQENLSENRTFSNFNKVRLRYTPDLFKDLSYDIFASVSNNNYRNKLSSEIADSLNQTSSHYTPHNVEVKQFIRYNTQPSYKHTTEFIAEHSFKKSNQGSDWDFDRPVLLDLLPILEDEDSNRYNLLQEYQSRSHSGKLNMKHYWIVNNRNHIYPIAGFYFFDQTYLTKDFQIMDNGDIHSFHTAGFDNDIKYQLLNPYFGLQYKFKIGEVIFRPGLMYQHYFWHVNQFQEKIVNNNKAVLLPEFRLEYKSRLKSLSFEYALRSSFADAEKYANRLSLQSYNLLYRGNEKIENSLYHNFSLLYRNVDIAKKLNYNVHINYSRQEKSVQQATMLEGIDQVNSVIYQSFPENSLFASGTINKRINKFSVGLHTQASLSDYSRIVNEKKLNYESKGLGYRVNLRSAFKNLPNFDIGFRHNFNWMQSENYKSKYLAANPYIETYYQFLKNFTFKADYSYSYTKYDSELQNQSFQIANTSLYYKKQNSLLSFEIKVENIFEAKYMRQYSLNEFMTYDKRTYLQPRTVLFVVSYQL